MFAQETLCWADSCAFCHTCLQSAAGVSEASTSAPDGNVMIRVYKPSVSVKLCTCVLKLTLLRGLPCLSFGALKSLGTWEVMLFHAELGERLVSVCQKH